MFAVSETFIGVRILRTPSEPSGVIETLAGTMETPGLPSSESGGLHVQSVPKRMQRWSSARCEAEEFPSDNLTEERPTTANLGRDDRTLTGAVQAAVTATTYLCTVAGSASEMSRPACRRRRLTPACNATSETRAHAVPAGEEVHTPPTAGL